MRWAVRVSPEVFAKGTVDKQGWVGWKDEPMSSKERTLGSRIWRANRGYRLLTDAQRHLQGQCGLTFEAPPVLLIRKLKTQVSNERTYLEKLKLSRKGFQFSEAELAI